MKQVLNISLAALCGLALAACNTSGPARKPEEKRIFAEYHYALDSILKTTAGTVAGIELGEPRKMIRTEQVRNAADQDKEGLVYEEKIDSLTHYSITYTFENDTISEIEVMINCESRDEGDKILTDLKEYYRKKYTAPLMDKGYFVFNCFDSRKRNFKITLTDNGSADNSVIDMLIYREQ